MKEEREISGEPLIVGKRLAMLDQQRFILVTMASSSKSDIMLKTSSNNARRSRQALHLRPAVQELEDRTLLSITAVLDVVSVGENQAVPIIHTDESTSNPGTTSETYQEGESKVSANATGSFTIVGNTLSETATTEADEQGPAPPPYLAGVGSVVVSGSITVTTPSTVLFSFTPHFENFSTGALYIGFNGSNVFDKINGDLAIYNDLTTTIPITISAGTYSYDSDLVLTSTTSGATGLEHANLTFSMNVSSLLAATTTTLSPPSPNPSTYGQPVTLTATVSPSTSNSSTPTGTVTFMDGSIVLNPDGSPINTSGVATFDTSTLPAGTDSITAVYGGDSNFSSSTSSPVSQVVNQAATTTALTATPNPVTFGQTVEFSGIVSPPTAGLPSPTGMITLLDGTTEIGVGTLVSGAISFSTSTLAVGNHPITLIYDGDPNYEGSISPTLNLQVNRSVVKTKFQHINLMHKLIYAFQNLAVNVSVTNNSAEEVTGTEIFYLSTNQNPRVQGDRTALLAIGNVYLDLLPGQTGNLPHGTDTLTVTIPGNIQPGTYYLKAVFSGNDDKSDDTVAVSPALTTCVNSSGKVSNFSSYPQNAAVFDSAVTVVKQGNPPTPTINSVADIKTFVEGNEAKIAAIYYPYSDVGVPAIGFGSDLEDKTTKAVNIAYKFIITTYISGNPGRLNSQGNPLTFQDFLNLDRKAYINKATAIELFNSGFHTAQAYVRTHYIALGAVLTLNQQAALIDMAYNLGGVGLGKFVSMNNDINMGTALGFACAGLELVNSQRTTQIPRSRTLADFYLLTSSAGVADQL